MTVHVPAAFAGAVATGGRPGKVAAARLLDPASLPSAELEAWAELAARAPSACVFARPWFVRAGLRHCDPAGEARLLVVEDEAGWIGVLPIHPGRWVGNTPLPHIAAWTHPNQFLASPLARPGAEPRFWEAVLAALDERSALAFVLRAVAADDPLFAALKAVCAAQGRPFRMLRTVARPVLRSDKAAPAASGGKRGGRLRALAARAERELGPLRLERLSDAGAVADWCDAFLAMERSGWKGREGSALAQDGGTEALFREVMEAGFAAGQLRAVSLLAGNAVLARSTYFLDGARGWGFKSSFDERVARHGPGVLLLDEITRELHAAGMTLFDSGSAAEQEPVASMWPARRTLADCAVALGQRRRGLFIGLNAAAAAWSRAKQGTAWAF